MFDLVDQRVRSAQSVLTPLLAQLDVKDEESDGLLGRVSDDIWNDIGRPASDPTFSLLFPDGIGFYTDGPDDEQPIKMELLAELLEANLHPKLDGKKAKSLGKQIRDSAKALRTAVEQVQTPRAQVAMLSRARSAIARSLQISLVNLKRHYKATGISDAQIHSIIPDRSRPAAKPAAAVQGSVRAIWESKDTGRTQALATGMSYTSLGNPIGKAQVVRSEVPTRDFEVR